MLQDLIMNLLSAGDKKEKEKAYKQLEKIGVDRASANAIVNEMMKEQGAKEAKENA